jgi:hypothetical protein
MANECPVEHAFSNGQSHCCCHDSTAVELAMTTTTKKSLSLAVSRSAL